MMPRIPRWLAALAVGAVIAFAIAMVVLTILLAWSMAARAHGDAAWIQHEPAYKDRGGVVHCCNVQDCQRMPPEIEAELRPTTRGWALRGETFTYGRPGLYQVKPGEAQVWWWCHRDDGTGTGRRIPRCLFEPAGIS